MRRAASVLVALAACDPAPDPSALHAAPSASVAPAPSAASASASAAGSAAPPVPSARPLSACCEALERVGKTAPLDRRDTYLAAAVACSASGPTASGARARRRVKLLLGDLPLPDACRAAP